MTLAPVVLFVYNRPWHVRRTLEALMLNDLADQSTLYIYCDGPREGSPKEALINIEEARTIIRKKKWCKEVIIIERKENFGLAKSVIQGVGEVIERHGKIIVLEDDIITGKYFLKFMNDALIMYEKEEHVFGISGYKYPSISEIKETTYFLPISCSWSYGTWSNRWNKVSFNGLELKKAIKKNRLKKKMNFGRYRFYEMLEAQIVGNNDSWAIRFYASMFLDKSFFLYPNKSLVENIGFDNSGTHCSKEDYFTKVKICNEIVMVKKLNGQLNKEIVDKVRQSFELKNVNIEIQKGTYDKIRIFAKRKKNLINRILQKLI